MNDMNISTTDAILPAAAGNSVPRAAGELGEPRPLIIASDELLQGRRELWIEHRGEMYRLRLTSAGKLYMTK